MNCTHDDCDRPIGTRGARGLCHRHYKALRKNEGYRSPGTPTPCQTCGQTFQSMNRGHVYCGPPCREKTRPLNLSMANRKTWPASRLHYGSCVWCHELFAAQTSVRRYCSTTCHQAHTRLKLNHMHTCVDCGDGRLAPVWPGQKGLPAPTYVPGTMTRLADVSLPPRLHWVRCSDCARVRLAGQRRDYRRTARADGVLWAVTKTHRGRARRYGVPYEPIRPSDVYDRDGWTCQLCGGDVDPQLRSPDPASATIDHVIPMSKGGPHLWGNVQLAHRACNVDKADRLPTPSLTAT